nr:immunoglobulin heavy chain junction region [Mus musculus]
CASLSHYVTYAMDYW